MIVRSWKWLENIIHFFIYKVFKLKLSDTQWENILQFMKFGVVGILNSLICYVTYLILITFRMHYTPANIIGFSISVFNSYYWNNKYVFTTDGKRVWWKTFIKTYISYAGTGILLSNILLALWIEVFHIPEFIGPIINLVFTIPVNYLVNKLWAYKK